MALKLSIKDPRVKIIPTKKLTSFIKTLSDCNSMPQNVLRIYRNFSQDKSDKKCLVKEFQVDSYTKSEIEILKEINENIEPTDAFFKISDFKESDENLRSNYELNLNDLQWLNEILKGNRKTQESSSKKYLHELLAGCSLVLPKNEMQERNPVLESRCQKLREQQDQYLYNKMTKGVDMQRRLMPEDTISYQIKQINKQLIAVAQFIFSVAAGFAFGFIGIELLIGDLDFGFRLLLGIIIALIIAIAEIYFLAKKLNEYDDDELQKEILTVPKPGEKFKFE